MVLHCCKVLLLIQFMTLVLVSPPASAGGWLEVSCSGGILRWEEADNTSTYDFLRVSHRMERRQNEFFAITLNGSTSNYVGFDIVLEAGRWDYDLDLLYHDPAWPGDSAVMVSSTDCNEAFLFLGGLIVQYPVQGLMPYVTADAGVHWTAMNTNLAFAFGGGLKMPVSKRIALRVDVRRIIVKVDDAFPYFSIGSMEWYGIPFKETIPHTQLMAGFSFRLGKN